MAGTQRRRPGVGKRLCSNARRKLCRCVRAAVRRGALRPRAGTGGAVARTAARRPAWGRRTPWRWRPPAPAGAVDRCGAAGASNDGCHRRGLIASTAAVRGERRKWPRRAVPCNGGRLSQDRGWGASAGLQGVGAGIGPLPGQLFPESRANQDPFASLTCAAHRHEVPPPC